MVWSGPPPGRQRPDGLTRPPAFVGRRSELAQLDASLRVTRAGRPALVLVSADAGLGKTRLLREVETRARAERMHVCRGRACEDLPFPYLPFVEVLRDQLVDVPEAVNRVLGRDAERLLALVRGESAPELASQVERGLERPHGRMGLLFAVSRVIVELARIRPTLLVLDDLHWADAPTLEQLLHLVFTVADQSEHGGIALCIGAAFRPPAPDSLLGRAVVRLGREAICTRLELSELGEDESADLIQSITERKPTRRLVLAVREITGGNPLFVEQVLAELAKRRALSDARDYCDLERDFEELELSKDLTGAIEARARDISRRSRETLILAACVAERFAFSELASLTEVGEEEVLVDLEEGLRADLLDCEGETFQFRHPLVRQAFYRMPSAARRQKLHAQIAARLEEFLGARAPDRAFEIARHLVRAGSGISAAKLARFSELAADQAFARGAWVEAARFYSVAASASTRHQASPPTLAGLHFRAGLASYRSMDVGPAIEQYDRSIARHRDAGDLGGLAQVLVERTRARLTPGHRPFDSLAEVAPLEELFDELGPRESLRRGQLAEMLSEAYWTGGRFEDAEAWARRAVAIAREISDDRLCAQSLTSLGVAQMQRMALRPAFTSLAEALSHAQRSGDPWIEGQPLQRLPVVLVGMGRLEEANALALQGSRLTRRTQDWAEHSLSLGTFVMTAVASGRFEEAERQAREVLSLARRSQYPWGAALASLALAAARVWRGRYAAAEAALEPLVDPQQGLFADAGPAIEFAVRVYRELARAHASSTHVEGTSWAVQLLAAMPDPRADLQTLGLFCAAIETAERIGDANLAARAYAVLEPAAERGVVLASGWPFLVPRLLGVAARMNGWWERAELHLAGALEAATRAGARAELARVHLDLARLRAGREGPGDREAAVDLLRSAVRLLGELEMEPFAHAAIDLCAQLGVRLRVDETPEVGQPTETPASTGEVDLVLLVSDMEGSTALLERLGDVRAHAVMEHHNRILRACVFEHRGREVQHTGDGLIASFPSPAMAVDCAAAIQQDLGNYSARHPDTPIRVRIGVHAGAARSVENRLLGATVNATVRIAAAAAADEILVSESVREKVPAGRFDLRERGPAHLKGFSAPFLLHEVRWRR